MRHQALRIRLSPDATVRLLLTAVMGVILALMVLATSLPAAAQTINGSPELSRDEIVAQLGETYKEVPVAGGIAANGNFLEVFATPDGRSWTIIVTRPDGASSVVASGEGWSFVDVVEGLRV